jgi:hypothetical protein
VKLYNTIYSCSNAQPGNLQQQSLFSKRYKKLNILQQLVDPKEKIIEKKTCQINRKNSLVNRVRHSIEMTRQQEFKSTTTENCGQSLSTLTRHATEQRN